MALRGWVITKNAVWGRWERWGRQQEAAGCEGEAAEPSHRAHPGVPPLLSKAPGAYRVGPNLCPPSWPLTSMAARLCLPRSPAAPSSAAWPAIVASALCSVAASNKALTAGQGSRFLGLSRISRDSGTLAQWHFCFRSCTWGTPAGPAPPDSGSPPPPLPPSPTPHTRTPSPWEAVTKRDPHVHWSQTWHWVSKRLVGLNPATAIHLQAMRTWANYYQDLVFHICKIM